MSDAAGPIDPALVGRTLGPWYMVPWWISVPLAVVVGGVLAWYFFRLGRPDVPPGRRFLRRASAVIALVALVPLVRALTFVHPHEDRVGFAAAWSGVLLLLLGCLVLAIIDVIVVTRGGIREYRKLRRETLGGKQGGTGDG